MAPDNQETMKLLPVLLATIASPTAASTWIPCDEVSKDIDNALAARLMYCWSQIDTRVLPPKAQAFFGPLAEVLTAEFLETSASLLSTKVAQLKEEIDQITTIQVYEIYVCQRLSLPHEAIPVLVGKMSPILADDPTVKCSDHPAKSLGMMYDRMDGPLLSFLL